MAAAVAVLLFSAAGASAQTNRPSALQSLLEAERAFAKMSVDQGSQAAFLRHMAPDGLLYRPRVVRAHAYLAARPFSAVGGLLWEPVFADVSTAGDLGYTTGPWINSHRGDARAQPMFGQYVTIWRRQRAGGWKAELHAGIAHGPDAIGPRGLTRAPASEWRAPRPDSAGALRALFAADSALPHIVREQGVATTFRRYGAPELRLLRMGRFPLMADSAHNYLAATPQYTFRHVGGGVARSGDLGYTYGIYAHTMPGVGSRATEAGDYLRIWRRAANGEWRVVLDLTSPAQPR
jgi:ketosteroid isomerase-like protein